MSARGPHGPPALLEVCVDTPDGLLHAQQHGAGRIELCARLDLGGLTPTAELRAFARERARVPVHAMLRPSVAPGFVATAADFQRMKEELAELRSDGWPGVVFGLLTQAARIDLARTRELVQRARPMAVTFHRAFDRIADKSQALEELVELGIERVLTSGGPATAWEGRDELARLVEKARGRIVVMPGGGVRTHDAGELLRATVARELHASKPFRVDHS